MNDTVTAVDELKALPVLAVVRDAAGEVFERQSEDFAPRGWLSIGSELDVHSGSIALPAQLLYLP